MGILVITWNFPPRRGGIETLMANLCRELRKRHPLYVITSFADGLPKNREGIFRPRLPGLLFFSLYALSKGFSLLLKYPEIGFVFGGSAMVAPLVLLLARLFRRKTIILVHGLDIAYPSRLYQSLCVRWLKHCDRIVANSRYTASLAEEKRVRPDKICVIPPGVSSDFSAFLDAKGAKKNLGLEGRKVLLFVGRLARRKGLREFLERSFVQIVSEISEAYFLIVGDNPGDSLVHRGDLLRELRDVVQLQGLQGHVRFLTSVGDSELAKLYQASDLLVLPTLFLREDVEGFGIVVLEAAAVGVPCVAMRVGGIPDAIENGRGGVLVEPGEYECFSRTVIDLLRDEFARRVLGQYAQKRVSEKFNWSSLVGRYETVFDEVTAPHE